MPEIHCAYDRKEQNMTRKMMVESALVDAGLQEEQIAYFRRLIGWSMLCLILKRIKSMGDGGTQIIQKMLGVLDG